MKNAFLNEDLEKKVYMDVPLEFSSLATEGKYGDKITVLIVYVDDIVATGNDEEKMSKIKAQLSREFEIKDLGPLRYFLGIEIARSNMGIFISQRKYILDLLEEVGMLGCSLADSSIEANHRLSSSDGEHVDKGRYQRLVRRLIYLSDIKPNIAYAVGVVSKYMHDPQTGHLDAVH
ncbi:uncharacterized protein LOC114288733 [Camellia sinensis]|uniref:uncharacterized protein LOC114288733 n=1 Tax=Camellia sinensis TaxID=4442 RepID=UPI001035A580|nr:uncharacterized protein LOC114288733 [Camellia sinensis]